MGNQMVKHAGFLASLVMLLGSMQANAATYTLTVEPN